MNSNLRNFALDLISKSPQVANNQQAQGMIDVIKQNDSARGEQIAQNICNSYGVSKHDALKQARRFFGF